MRRYAAKTALVTTSGAHIRYIPAALAKAMVDAGTAAVEHSNGKVRSIKLLQCAASHLVRIGEPSDATWRSPKFVTREKLDCGGVVWRHHPRCWE